MNTILVNNIYNYYLTNLKYCIGKNFIPIQ